MKWSPIGKSIETESRLMVAEGWGWGFVYANGWIKYSKVDWGNGCTVLWVY